jgi:translation initiation factor 1
MADDKYRTVYSTELGALCPNCARALKSCTCSADQRALVRGDGNVKVRRETKARGGKTVTSISGLALNQGYLKGLLSDLKRLVGGGGTIKDGVLELQGDHCESIIAELGKRGIRAKRAGG